MPRRMSRRTPGVLEFVEIPLGLFAFFGFELLSFGAGGKSKRILVGRILFVFNAVMNIPTKIGYMIYENLSTPLEITAYVVFCTFMGNALAKGASVWLIRAKLKIFFKCMLECFPKSEQDFKEYKVNAYYLRIYRYNKYLTVFHLAVTTTFNILPIAQSALEYWIDTAEDKQFTYRFPYMMSYPVNEERPFCYIPLYVAQCMGAYNLSCFFLGSDLLLITAIHLVNMHFEYLIQMIRNFEPTRTDKDIKTLCWILDRHEKMLKYSSIIDDAFSISILLNYVASCFVICLIGFQIVAGTEIPSLLKFCLFLMSSLTHIYYISCFGNEMSTLSADISQALFEHPWYDANVAYQRLLVLPIERAQRPAQLTAFKFFVISMETFKTLMTTSYQFFTLIRSRFSEEN